MQSFIEKERIEDVHFTGLVPNEELPRYYGISDIFVLTSIYEPWGVVVNEAMASGLPIILSDKVGCRGELLREGENGFYFHSGNWKDLSLQIERFIGKPEMMLKMGLNSRMLIKKYDYYYCEKNLEKALSKCSISR